MRTASNRWLREPLLHFLVLGALLFGLHALINNPPIESERSSRIEVSASDIDRFRGDWISQRGRPPTEEELQWLIDQFAREEVLYREALALGLDRGDYIVRRRLVQKMEFLSQDLALLANPIEDELATYFLANRERYRIPTRLSFSHIYFNQDQRAEAAEQDAQSVLAQLQAEADSPMRAPEQGDPFLLQDYYPAQSPQEVAQLFGDGFSQELFAIEPGTWQGPVESSYGLHLVRVHHRIESRLPELAEVRDQVRWDLMAEQRQEADEVLYARLLERYEVKVDEKAAAQQATKLEPSSKK